MDTELIDDALEGLTEYLEDTPEYARSPYVVTAAENLRKYLEQIGKEAEYERR